MVKAGGLQSRVFWVNLGREDEEDEPWLIFAAVQGLGLAEMYITYI